VFKGGRYPNPAPPHPLPLGWSQPVDSFSAPRQHHLHHPPFAVNNDHDVAWARKAIGQPNLISKQFFFTTPAILFVTVVETRWADYLTLIFFNSTPNIRQKNWVRTEFLKFSIFTHGRLHIYFQATDSNAQATTPRSILSNSSSMDFLPSNQVWPLSFTHPCLFRVLVYFLARNLG